MKILISACLLGQNVRYDANHNSILQNPLIKRLLDQDILIPVCPEVDGGLPIPRLPVELIGKKAIDSQGNDKTKNFTDGANKSSQLALKYNINIAIMKAKSPSCGKGKIYDGAFNKKLINGDGITVKALERAGVKVFSEEDLEELEKILDI